MPTSDARINANRLNSLKSSGPVTAQGKEKSRSNSLKHGLTGQGVVLAEVDSAEVERLREAFTREMAPKSARGAILILQLATLSVRMERGAKHEFAAIAARVRHAADDFDEERIEKAEALLKTIAENPRTNLRKLRKMPEGVELLLETWQDLRANLTGDPKSTWSAANLAQAANLLGIKEENARSSKIGTLWSATGGDFTTLADHEGGHLDAAARQAWARDRLVERIDEVIAELEAHYEDLDHEMIALDRAEAGGRALFDPSKQAALARRYESEARRGFFKALNEFRQVEAEFAEQSAPASKPQPAPEPRQPSASPAEPLASSWEPPDPLPGESFEQYRDRAMRLDMAAQKAQTRPQTTRRPIPNRS